MELNKEYTVRIILPAGSLVCYSAVSEQEVTKILREYLGRAREIKVITLPD